MFVKTNETKVLRDPVHGYIHVDDQVIWDLINSSWFQRLRRVRQLGGAYMVYHCAEHSRFSHSLGVYEIVRRMVTEVGDLKKTLSEKEKITAMCAGLLHDIGHGPYSHSFETVSKISHEVMTCRIIEKDPEIRGILESTCQGLAKDTADIIRHKSSNPLLSQLISSQLDADRMDYLLRDAYFTGTKYGEFDLERILRTLRTEKDRLVIKQSGVYAVENYIMARYHMYWQVYYHPTARSYEVMLHALFQRLRDLKDPDEPHVLPQFYPLIRSGSIPLADYFALDEDCCNYGFSLLCDHPDAVVRDLSYRIINRRLFEFIAYSSENEAALKKQIKERGLDPKYYVLKDEVRQKPYVPYNGEAGSIFVKMNDGSVREISNASNIVYSLIHGPQRDEKMLFFPKTDDGN